MRPTYETKADRERERKVAAFIARKEGLSAVQMPLRYHVDFAFVDSRDKVAGWAEVKCRNNPMARYPTYMLSLAKYHAMVQLARETWLPVRLVVHWTDSIGALLVPADHEIGFGGRADRSDWQDREPVAHFPVSSFQVLWRQKGPV